MGYHVLTKVIVLCTKRTATFKEVLRFVLLIYVQVLQLILQDVSNIPQSMQSDPFVLEFSS